MAKSRRQQVRERAQDRCEYCQVKQEFSSLPHELDHIRARKHHGPTTLANLCFACAQCNGAKSSDAAGYDPQTDELVPLFNPRKDRGDDHFTWRGPTLLGKTKIGRATIDVLQINEVERVEFRRMLIELGVFPP
jgi:hypothetical protein